MTTESLPTETLKSLSSLPILTQESFWRWRCSDRYVTHLRTSFFPFSPSLISLMVSVDVKHHVYCLYIARSSALHGRVPPVLSSALLLILSASRFLVPSSLPLVPAPFLFPVPLRGMTIPFLSERNPVWPPSNQTSKQFFFQYYRPAVFSVPCCCLHPSQVSVCCPF